MVDQGTVESTASLLAAHSAQLPKSARYYFLLGPVPAVEAPHNAHKLFNLPFFQKDDNNQQPRLLFVFYNLLFFRF